MIKLICDTTAKQRTRLPIGGGAISAASVPTFVGGGATALGTPAWSPPVC